MSTTPRPNPPSTLSSKKRKSDAHGSGRPMKQSKKINDYFLPLHPIPSNLKEVEGQPVPLNEEQKKVLEMVVDRGKNVFFTGAAGTHFAHLALQPPFLVPLVADLMNLVKQEPESHYCSKQLLLLSGGNTQRNLPLFLSLRARGWLHQTLVVRFFLYLTALCLS